MHSRKAKFMRPIESIVSVTISVTLKWGRSLYLSSLMLGIAAG